MYKDRYKRIFTRALFLKANYINSSAQRKTPNAYALTGNPPSKPFVPRPFKTLWSKERERKLSNCFHKASVTRIPKLAEGLDKYLLQISWRKSKLKYKQNLEAHQRTKTGTILGNMLI